MSATQPKDFRYYLTYNGTTTLLEHDPRGWLDYATTFARSEKYIGVFRTFTEKLQFVKDGAAIIRKAFDEKFTEGEVVLLIERLEVSTRTYLTDYIGYVNLSTIRNYDTYIEANINSSGALQKLEAYADIEYDIPIPVPATDSSTYLVKVPDGGIVIKESVDFGISYFETGYTYPVNVVGTVLSNEIELTDTYEFSDVQPTDSHEYKAYAGTDKPHFIKRDNVQSKMRITTKVSSEFDNVIQTRAGLGGTGENVVKQGYGCIELRRYFVENPSNPDDPSLYEVVAELARQDFDMGNYGWVLYDISVDAEVTITNAGRYYVVYKTYKHDGTENWCTKAFYGGGLYFTFEATTAAFDFYAMPLHLLLDRLTKAMGITNGSISNYLSSTWRTLFVTSGDAIRNIENPVIRTSFKDFFNSVNSVLNIGIGINDERVLLERKSYFYQEDKMLFDIGDVKDCNFSVDVDNLATGIQAGYEDQTYDDVNGRDEFNTQLDFEMPITKLGEKEGSNVLDLKSKYRADSYGVVFQRLRMAEKKTTDSERDNKTFFIHAKNAASGQAGMYELNRDLTVLSGSLSPKGVFNVEISPKRNLMRWNNVLAYMTYKQGGKDIKFTSIAKADSDLVSERVGIEEPVTERANIRVGSLGYPLRLPIIAEFTTKVPYNLPMLLGSLPYGYIQFTYGGNVYKGFIKSIEEQPAMNRQRTWQLYLHPSTPANLLQNL